MTKDFSQIQKFGYCKTKSNLLLLLYCSKTFEKIALPQNKYEKRVSGVSE